MSQGHQSKISFTRAFIDMVLNAIDCLVGVEAGLGTSKKLKVHPESPSEPIVCNMPLGDRPDDWQGR